MREAETERIMLTGFTALDLSDEKGIFCGKLLSDLGADVIQIEPPEGNHVRRLPPFCKNSKDPERSLQWLAYAQGKKSICLDLKKNSDKAILLKLVEKSTWVIESFPPGHLEKLGLGYEVLRKSNPHIILVRISPFGQTGPYSKFKTADIVALAMSGVMYTFGEPDRCPVRISTPHSQAYLQAGAEAAVASVLALFYQQRTGEGQVVDLSIRESLFWCTANAGPWWELHKLKIRRAGARRLGRGHGSSFGVTHRLVWPCKDGYVCFAIFGGGMGSRINAELIKWMDQEGSCDDFLRSFDWMKFDLDNTPSEDLLHIEEMIEKFFRSHTKTELFEDALTRRIMLYPVNDTEDILNNLHLKARKYWTEVKHPELGKTLRYPGPFVRSSSLELQRNHRAPFKGEHGEKILSELKNLNDSVIQKMNNQAGGRQILEGIKVVEFSTGAVGPIIGKYLADHGATVIHVESEVYPSSSRVSAPWKGDRPHPDRSGYYALYYTGKYNLALNLSVEEGRKIAKKLVLWADVVVENFAPGVMKRWGLDYEVLAKEKQDIIMISSSNAGQTGPLSTQPAYGIHLNGLAGFNNLTGWPDREPSNPSPAYTDYVAPRLGACALIAALIYHQRTGKGQHLDHSQLEASLHFLAPLFLELQTNNQKTSRNGNRVENAAPHGAYRCKGDDRWCAIAIETDVEWQSLCRVIGKPDLAFDRRFSTMAARKLNEGELDSLVEAWTSEKTAGAVMNVLQNEGIASGIVATMEDFYGDPQIGHRKFLQTLEHPDLGFFHYVAHPFIFSQTPSRLKRSPRLGENTMDVLSGFLGYADDEIVELLSKGVLR